MKTFYETVYNTLYDNGYHSSEVSHAAKEIVNVVPKYLNTRSKILDVGCSNGWVVKTLQDNDYDSYGIDIANRAIELCKNRGIQENKVFVASMTQLPFQNNFFDAIVSTDVIEHILPEDLDLMVNEFYRVTTKYIICDIATKIETDKSHIKQLSNQLNGILNNDELHTTVYSSSKWIDTFTSSNKFKLIDSKVKYVPSTHAIEHLRNTESSVFLVLKVIK